MKSIFNLVCIFMLSGLTLLSANAENSEQEEVKKLLILTGSGEMAVQMLEQMMPTMKAMAPDAPEEFWVDFMKEINPETFVDLIVPIYQKHLSSQDIKELIQFYESPIGKKLVKVQPMMLQESMLVGQQWGEGIGLKLVEKYKKLKEQQ